MRYFAICLLLLSCGVACSDPAPAGASLGAAGQDAAATGDAAAGDGATADTKVSDGQASDGQLGDAQLGDAQVGDAQVGDGQLSDAPSSDAASAADIDYDLLDPEDTDSAAPDLPPLNNGLAAVFAHTSSQLYRLENNVFTLVGTFSFNKAFGQVTDIALDDAGLLFAVTFNDLFQCDKTNAKCTWLASLPQQFNGLTFVPKDVVTPGQPALIGVANSGDWNLITVKGTTATIQKLGSYGGYASSGDAFSVEGVGTYATVKSGFGGTDKLVQVNPANGAVLKTIGDTGVSDLWGIAWSNQVLYGFSDDGKVYSLNMQTGKASTIPGLQVPSGSWWGAGVSTRAGLK